MMKPAAALWDMDGTLVDTEPYWINAEIELMNANGLKWTKEQGLQFVGNDLLTSARMLREEGLELPAEVIVDKLLARVVEQVKEGVPFRPGAWELLSNLRAEGIPCALVTMSYRILAEAVVAACPPESFVTIVSGDEVERGKPDPEAYLKAAALLGVEPSACVAFEDSIPGLASAEAAGTMAVGVPHLVDLPSLPNRTLWSNLDGKTTSDVRELFSRQSS